MNIVVIAKSAKKNFNAKRLYNKIIVNFKAIKETVSECTNYIHPVGDTTCLLYYRDVYLTGLRIQQNFFQ